MRYPTAISQLLGFTLVDVELGRAVMALQADAARHGNQQGTVHGGLLVELADAAIGTAQSTVISRGESFTTIDLTATFLRPVWAASLTATAERVHVGRTISHFVCEIIRDDGKPIARICSAVMTLRGEQAAGR
ncbi:PaaI family thioesterase [Gordonia soli]|uniref:PaaI family thioesterase n=1 Tax=Gordonia soli TaxID=320799 RepID=UPI001C3F3016|nr:PaaI family thioesterase [Gordonia soli]